MGSFNRECVALKINGTLCFDLAKKGGLILS
jgi:hypothetical protein